jgi:Ser/Thr protein kinase RdoA (MazF antagonist)
LLAALSGRPSPPFPPVVAVLDDALVTRFVGDGSAVSERVLAGRLAPDAAGALVGHALGKVLASGEFATLSAAARAPMRPWGLRLLLEPPPRFVVEHPPAMALHDELSRRRSLTDGLRGVAATWSPTGLVHGDLRWDNCLIDVDGQAVLVDWESAGWGDPAWDVGCAAAEHFAWGPLAPDAAAPPTANADGLTHAYLAMVGPELTSLVTAYRAAGGWRAIPMLPRIAGYTAARLVHIAFQWTYWDAQSGAGRARMIAAVAAALLNDLSTLDRWLGQAAP